MGINKFLCKYYDIEEKGYVTVGDFIGFTLFLIIIAGIIYSLLYSVYRFFAEGAFWADVNHLETPLIFLFGALIICIIIFFLVCFAIAAICVAIQELLNVKIARCVLKEKSKEPEDKEVKQT